MDAEVGHASTEAVAIDVDSGLAVVRELNDERVFLWQGAPSIEFELRVANATELELEVWNTMPGSELSRVSGGPVRIEPGERTLPTRARFRLAFESDASDSPVRFALTAPRSEQESLFRVALMSDVQEAIDTVSDLYDEMNEDPQIEFLLGAGDLTEDGARSELRRFEEELRGLNVPYYTTLGNHELGVSPPQYQGMFGRGSFSFTYRGARFTLLDSASATIDPGVYDWLDEWLEQGREQFHIVGMHVPPIDPIGTRGGSFASRNEANKLLARLLAGGVDLTVYGHLHSYFSYNNGGIAARVSGGGGAIPERFDGIGRHFLTIDIEPETESFRTTLVEIEND